MLVSSNVLGDIKCHFSPFVIGPVNPRFILGSRPLCLSMSGHCYLLPTSKTPAAFLIFMRGGRFGEMCTLEAASCDLTPDFAWLGCVLG